MKYITRIHINNSISIPRDIRENIVLDNYIVKWVINKNKDTVYMYFIKDNNVEIIDEHNEDYVILFRKIHTNMSLTIPGKIRRYLGCMEYDYIEWTVNDTNIIVKSLNKTTISDISGLFKLREVH